MYRRSLFVICLCLAVCFGVGSAPAEIINGDFSAALTTGWTSGGDTTRDVINEKVIIGDATDIYSFLYQGVSLPVGSYTLDLDFNDLISTFVPTSDPFAGPDYFAASLYFIDDLSTFDPMSTPPVFDGFLALFDLGDSSPKGAGWTHYSTTFQNTHAYVLPMFEFFDLNFVTNDSQVFLDNIRITELSTPIPEPGTLLLLSAGLACLVGTRIRHKKNLLA